MKNTRIVATIGPASEQKETLKAMSEAGVNIFRLNFSHGSHESHLAKVNNIRELGVNCAILLDTKGPEIRTGEVKGELELKTGDTFTMTINSGVYEDTGKLSVNYKEFINDVDVGDKIVLDSGVMVAEAIEKNKEDIKFKVIRGSGVITSRRHVNLQGKRTSLPTVTENDWKDIQFAVDHKLDFIALSFVRSAADVKSVKDYCAKNGHGDIKIISKIENFEGTQNLEEIVEASDGIMVARGDLACEVPFTKVPKLQNEMIDLCSYYEKPVIIATQMLLSMVTSPTPTRAEVSDVANAVFDYVDAVMLSDETTKSFDPVHAVKTMADIAIEVEDNLREDYGYYQDKGEIFSLLPKLTQNVDAVAVVGGDTWKLAAAASSARMNLPIFAFTSNDTIKNQLNLLYATTPFKIELSGNVNEDVIKAEKIIKEQKKDIASYVLISEESVGGETIPTMQIRKLKR